MTGQVARDRFGAAFMASSATFSSWGTSERSRSSSGLVPDALKVRSARILLESLAVQADIGFHEFEVGAPQRLLVTVEIWLEDVRAA